MKITVRNQVGDVGYDIEVEGTDSKEVLFTAVNFAKFPDYCHVCQKPTNIYLEARKAEAKDKKEYTYIKAVCKVCGAKSTLGSYQDTTKGHFWKRFEKFEGKTQTESKEEDGGDTPF